MYFIVVVVAVVAVAVVELWYYNVYDSQVGVAVTMPSPLALSGCCSPRPKSCPAT